MLISFNNPKIIHLSLLIKFESCGAWGLSRCYLRRMSNTEQLIHEGEFTYLEQGEGKPLILLHGLFGALSNFKEVVDHFKLKYKVIIPMLPLYTMPVLTTGVKSLAEFVERFIKHKGFEKVNLLGNSLGGHVALVLTKRNPEKVRCYSCCCRANERISNFFRC